MTKVPSIIGGVVAEIVRSSLLDAANGRRPGVRLTGFDEQEIAAIVAALQGLRLPNTDEDVTIKVGTVADTSGIPTEYRLAPGETLTHWRNRDVPALVVIDWDPHTEEEGLAALNRLDDRSVLADGDEELAIDRLRLVIEHAWAAAGRTDGAPERLCHDLVAVRAASTEGYPRALRRWTAFVSAACEDLAHVDLLTPDEVDAAAGRNLASFGLFPDEEVFADGRSTRTRLVRNLRVSELLQPSGAAISDDDLLLRIENTKFDERLLAERDVDPSTVRARMRAVVQGGGDQERRELDLSLWLELFERRSSRAGLGQLVREHLAIAAPRRLDEFEHLDVEAGLDHSEQESAERLVRAEPPDNESALIDVLTVRLRRRVEKVAFPDAQLAADPLRALLHGLHVLEDLEGSVVRLGLESMASGTGGWSKWLFAFLYGHTLQEVSERTTEGPCRLVVDHELVNPRRPALPAEDDEFEIGKAWAPLRLIIDVTDRGARRFRWDPLAQPGLVAFAALIQIAEPIRRAPSPSSLDQLWEEYLDPRSWAAPHLAAPTGQVATDMDATRTAMLRQMGGGLSADALDEYIGAWADHLDRARDSLVPSNAPLLDLADVVLTDIAELGDGHLAMLGVHPLRLRWLSSHLRRLTDLLVRCLSNELALNPENPELFFEWLERASPHATPPVVVGSDETVAVAVREVGWHEEYAPIRSRGHEQRDWLAAVDDAAIEEMVSVIVSYLDTYPYKRDGLVLLLLVRDGSPRVAFRVVQRLRARTAGLRLELHVFTPRSAHHELVRAFEEAHLEDDASSESLFPEVQLVLHQWDPDTEPQLDDLRDRVDVALAPALFGTRTSLKALTRSRGAGLSGRYDPWLHHAAHDLPQSGENVVRVMLPSQLDSILESWSTLCVRHDAHSAVAPQQESNTDYFALQVRFDRHQQLFSALHEVAHWVVTLDAFIGRDQIDALEQRPDVILVRTGVGKNEAYTLIVSSASGRRFVVKRLVRKLRSDLGFPADPPLDQVADRIYSVARHVVPGAVLRALGLGQAANEVIGLVASRYEIARQFPLTDERPGLEVWISFDEHQDWFGRGHRMRADLGRFVFTVDDDTDKVRLSVLVVESKFRQNPQLGTAEQQLDRTTDLCSHAFGGNEPTVDAEFWHQELAAAIDQTSRVEVPAEDLPARRVVGPHRVGLEDLVLQSLRAGSVVLQEVNGVAVGIASQVTAPAPEPSTLGRHHLLRLYQPELASIVRDLVAFRAPFEAEGRSTSVEIRREATRGREDAAAPPAAIEPTAALSSDAASGVDAEETIQRKGLSDDDLRRRYEQLLDVLRQHNVLVDPPPMEAWRQGPGFYVLRVVPRPGVTVDRVVNRVDEIALALALQAGARIRTSLDRGTIAFEVPKSPAERYPVPAADLWGRRPIPSDRLEVVVGEDITGGAVAVDFSSPDSPHLLIAGTTGSGKSVALETVLRGLCRYPNQAVRLLLVDPKGTELIDFAEDAHTEGEVGIDASDAIAILEEAVAEMQNRYQLMRPERARSLAEYNAKLPPDARLSWRVIVLDEYADLTSDPNEKAQIEQLLRRLTQKARGAGIHVIVATQRPSADVVSTTIRSNFPAQLALRVKSATDSRIIMDEPGAETLAGQGDAFLRTTRGTTRLQVALV